MTTIKEDPHFGDASATCGSASSSVQLSSTTPGRAKHARLSTWPLVSSSACRPRGIHSTRVTPSRRFSCASICSEDRLGLRFSCSRHSAVVINVLCRRQAGAQIGSKCPVAHVEKSPTRTPKEWDSSHVPGSPSMRRPSPWAAELSCKDRGRLAMDRLCFSRQVGHRAAGALKAPSDVLRCAALRCPAYLPGRQPTARGAAAMRRLWELARCSTKAQSLLPCIGRQRSSRRGVPLSFVPTRGRAAVPRDALCGACKGECRWQTPSARGSLTLRRRRGRSRPP
jgi:hypothetical protein